MKNPEVIIITILIIGFFCIWVLIVYWAVSYLELRNTIKECDKDFGAGNWTFLHDSEKYTCRYYDSKQYVDKFCTLNGKRIDCP